MPFKSEKQRRYLWMKEPEVAREFANKEKAKKHRDKAIKRRMKRGNKHS